MHILLRLMLASAAVGFCLSAGSVSAQETTPGAACTAGQTHLYRMSGGPELAGSSYLLSCNGTTWEAVTSWDTISARSLFQVNNDTGICNSTKLGRLRYNGTSTWDYCNGTAWTNLLSGATSTPASPDRGIQFNSGGSFAADANFVFTSTGNLGIGTANPAARLQIDQPNGSYIGPVAHFYRTGAPYGEPAFLIEDQDTNSSAAMRFKVATVSFSIGQNGGDDTFRISSSAELDKNDFVINSNGNVGVGKNNPGVALDVVGDINYTGVIVDVSDRRRKDNIAALGNDALEKIELLQGVSFTMKGDKAAKRELGFIAQDVDPVFPELVHTTPDGEKSLNYIGLIAPMVEAIKAQQKIIDSQQGAIDQLRADNVRLEALVREIDARSSMPPAALPDHQNR